MDKKVFRDISYGMYIVSSIKEDMLVGCVINTLCQITSDNPIISISLNKNNYTNDVIRGCKRFSVSIISNNTNREVISKFGYYSSRDTNKFDSINYDMIDGIPVVMENICSYLICEVVNIIDSGTHDVILARVINTKKVSDVVPMTYKYYQNNLKGVSPKNAPTYVDDESLKQESIVVNKYKCKLCGYIYDDSKESIKFEELEDDWKCPLCGASKSMFYKI